MKYIIQNPAKYIITFCISTFLFIALWVITLTQFQWLIWIDTKINNIIPMLHTPALTWFFYWVSELFEVKLFIIWFTILLLILTYKKKYFEAGFLFFGTFGGQFVKTVIKEITDKPRPENPFGIIDTASSFPSGHATTNIFLLLALYHFLIPHIKTLSIFWKKIVQLTFIFGMIALPFSRLFLQVHYTSDVLAGILLGIASFVFTILVFNYFYKKHI